MSGGSSHQRLSSTHTNNRKHKQTQSIVQHDVRQAVRGEVERLTAGSTSQGKRRLWGVFCFVKSSPFFLSQKPSLALTKITHTK
jgi:hypothetical protein